MSEKADAETRLRKRGWSIHSSDHDPDHEDFSVGDVDARIDEKSPDEHHSIDEGGNDDIEAFFVASSDEEEDYRQTKTNGRKDGPDKTTEMGRKLTTRKAQLSKWSLQFLDPTAASQRQMIIEPPKIIPLDDKYLQEFGKREREYDEAAGRSMDIDRSTLDNDEDEEDDEEQQNEKLKEKRRSEEHEKVLEEGCKARVSFVSGFDLLTFLTY